MKKAKKLVLNKETLRDLMAHNTGEVKGGRAPTRRCPTLKHNCSFGNRPTLCGPGCN